MERTLSTLVELFDQHREQLRLRLGEHPDSEHTVREVKTFLGMLLTAYGQEKDHSLTERRLCGFLFDAVAAAAAPLARCEIVADHHAGIALRPSSSRSTERGRWLLRGVYGVIAVALAGMLLQGGALTALALLGALTLLSVREWFSQASPPAALQPTPHFRMVVEVNTLLVTLREAMKAVDMVMAEASKPSAVAASALEEDGTLLDLIHELLRAAYAEDGVYALKHLNSLTFVLARQGVTLQNFTAENHHLFDTVPDLSPHTRTWRTLKPALVKKDGRLLRRGLVAEPTVSKEHLH
jgi:hypothetical protein